MKKSVWGEHLSKSRYFSIIHLSNSCISISMRTYPRRPCDREAQAHMQMHRRNEEARLASVTEERRLRDMGWEEASNQEQRVEGNTDVAFLNQKQNACQYWAG